MRNLLVLACSVISLISVTSPAHAGDGVLTEERIRAFYDMSMEAQKSGTDEIIAFLKKHTHENSTTVINNISHMQGAPKNEQSMSLGKKELLAETVKGRRAMDMKTIENSILSIEILDGGQSARVKDSTYSTMVLKMQGPGGQPVLFDVEQSMLCDTELVLSEEDVIQNKNNICNAEVNIKPKEK